MSDGLAFSRLMDEYGNVESRGKDTQKGRTVGVTKDGNKPLQYKPGSAEDVLMQSEERNVGPVSWNVYKKYLHFAGGVAWAPLILFLLILTQGNQGSVFSRFSSTLIHINTVQLLRRCFLDSGREIPYLASHKAVTWLYMLRLVQTSFS